MAGSLVLHIGDPKTGTSSIQEVLRHGLWSSDKVNLAYPEMLNAFPLANALWDKAQADRRAARWSATAAWLQSTEADVAVISAEQFFRVDPRVLRQTLSEFLPSYLPDLRVIAYVRPHVARLISAFMQRTKAGLFLGDWDLFWRRSQRDGLLDYAPRFQAWRDTFGDAFTLRPMIRSQLKNGDVVADFMDFALSGAPYTLKGEVEVNTSLSLQHLAGLREVQSVLKRQEVAVGTRHAVGDHVNRSLSRLAPGQGQKLRITPALYEEVRTSCAEDAALLDRDFLGGGNLMAEALFEAAQGTCAEAQSVLARDHFPRESLVALRGKARRLVAMFGRQPLEWTQDFETRIGQRPKALQGRNSEAAKAHVARVDSVLDEIARLIADHAAQANSEGNGR